MRKISKWILIILTSLILFIGLTISILYTCGYNLKNLVTTNKIEVSSEVKKTIEPIFVNPQVRLEDAIKLSSGNYSLKNSEFNKKREWTDEEIRQVLHEMSHQKIQADIKNGFMLITQERINSLQDIIKNKKFLSEVIYNKILKEWEKGNYSEAVAHHNTIWELQYGQIGEAFAISTENEEKEYIRSTLTRGLTFSSNSIVGWGNKNNKELKR